MLLKSTILFSVSVLIGGVEIPNVFKNTNASQAQFKGALPNPIIASPHYYYDRCVDTFTLYKNLKKKNFDLPPPSKKWKASLRNACEKYHSMSVVRGLDQTS